VPSSSWREGGLTWRKDREGQPNMEEGIAAMTVSESGQTMNPEKQLMQMLAVCGGRDTRCAYLSVPVSSGRRELELLNELRCDRANLRTRYSARYRAEVLVPNAEAAEQFAQRARELFLNRLVLNPAPLEVPNWSQIDYGHFWDDILRSFVDAVVLAPGWELSAGARKELKSAVELNLPVYSLNGSPLAAQDLKAADEAARSYVERSLGDWSPDAEEYLPPLPSEEAFEQWSPPGREGLVSPPFEHLVNWLKGEREYQVKKFGIAQDDNHTCEGLGEDGWWTRQLETYYHRARVLGVENQGGRQALAKFVATGCGLVESTIRLFGPLPRAGVSSGGNIVESHVDQLVQTEARALH
jgi:hypothetical protein